MLETAQAENGISAPKYLNNTKGLLTYIIISLLPHISDHPVHVKCAYIQYETSKQQNAFSPSEY